MVGSTKTDITLPKPLLHRIDNKPGDIPRSTFIRRTIENYIKTKGK
jgi:hypothetical protein